MAKPLSKQTGEMVTYVAKEMGIYQGRRVRRGEEFTAPENLKGKWFVKKEDYQEPKLPRGSQPMTFSELMRQPVRSQVEVLRESRPVPSVDPQINSDDSVI